MMTYDVIFSAICVVAGMFVTIYLCKRLGWFGNDRIY